MHSLQLDTRIRIERLTVGKDASGGITRTWALLGTVWAQRRDQSGTERTATTQAGGQVAEARTDFVIRTRPDLDATHTRVIHQGQVHNIRHVKPLAESKGWTILTCDTGVNDG